MATTGGRSYYSDPHANMNVEYSVQDLDLFHEFSGDNSGDYSSSYSISDPGGLDPLNGRGGGGGGGLEALGQYESGFNSASMLDYLGNRGAGNMVNQGGIRPHHYSAVEQAERFQPRPEYYHNFPPAPHSAADPLSPYSPNGLVPLAAYVPAAPSPPFDVQSAGAALTRFSTIPSYGSSSFSRPVVLPLVPIAVVPRPPATYSNYTPAQSLSPPDSNSSVHSHHSPQPYHPATNSTNGAFVHDSDVLRMIEAAQAQGSSSIAAVPPSRSPSFSAQHAQGSSQVLLPNPAFSLGTTYNNPLPTTSAYLPSSLATFQDPRSFLTGNFVSNFDSRPMNVAVEQSETKKRKLSQPTDEARIEEGASLPVPAKRSHKVGAGKKAKAAAAARELAEAEKARLVSEQGEIQVDSSLLLEGRPSKRRSPLEIIASAGVPFHEVPEESPPPVVKAKRKAYVKKEKKEKPPKKVVEKKINEKGHNVVERRYRNNINNHIATLRDLVPALRHLKPLPSLPVSRSRASQFSLPSSAHIPTPAGLIDGILAAKTLSKGTILGKSVEYIHFLQGARNDGIEDLEMLKEVIRVSLAGGEQLIAHFDTRRSEREGERELQRVKDRAEQQRMDDEDAEGDEDDEDEDEDERPELATNKHLSTASSTTRTSSASSSHPDIPTHLQTNGQGTIGSQVNLISRHDYENGGPSSYASAYAPLPHQTGRPRVLLVSFMGLSFAAGGAYDWTYNMVQEAGGDIVEPSAWAVGQQIAKRSFSIVAPIPPKNIVTSRFFHPSLLTAFIFLGVSTLISTFVYIVYPVIFRSSRTSVAIDRKRSEKSRIRKEALASLGRLSSVADNPRESVDDECDAALDARDELLRLVGAPTRTLHAVLNIAKEIVLMVVNRVISVGSLQGEDESTRVEITSAWVRIAEIESTVGSSISSIAKWYTFLRLFNLSRSTKPASTSTLAPSAVNAILAVHLVSLGQPTLARTLWDMAATVDRKKSDAALAAWVEVALDTDFDQIQLVLTPSPISSSLPARSSPSDTVPLLKLAEARCDLALREFWSKIFVAVIRTTCPPDTPAQPLSAFATLLDLPSLDETLDQIIESSKEDTSVHTLAQITKGLCAYRIGRIDEAKRIAMILRRESDRKGVMSRLGCANAFFHLVLGEEINEEQTRRTPMNEVDTLASVTLGWLAIRRRESTPADGVKAPDPMLHSATLAMRRLLGASVFQDASLATDGDLMIAQDACLEALSEVSRVAAGL